MDNVYLAKIRDDLHRYRKPILTMFFIYLLGISAILRANFYYIDDLGRARWGYKEFHYFSRYIPQYFSTFLHADSYLTDISPLPQLIAVLLLALAAVIVLRAVTERDTFYFVEYIAMIPLGLSPYFLQCLSYKYDSPYMGLSVLAAVLPVIFMNRGFYCYLLSTFLCSLVVCMSYQAAWGIFPMFVVLLAWIKWNRNEKWQTVLRFVFLSAIGYLAGTLFFALFLMKPADDYASTSLHALMEMIPMTLYHMKMYYIHVIQDFKLEWLVMIGLLCVGFIHVSVRNSQKGRVFGFAFSILVLLAFVGMCFGVYPALSRPTFDPRSMYGFGALLSFVAVYTVTTRRFCFYKTVCIALCWCFFVFGFTYGNALNAQKVYTDYRITAAIHDLHELDLFDEEKIKTYQIKGSIGYAPEIEGMPQDYEMLRRLVPISFADSEMDWGYFSFSQYYRLKNITWDRSIDLTEYNLPKLKDTYYHTIYADDEYVLIVLKW